MSDYDRVKPTISRRETWEVVNNIREVEDVVAVEVDHPCELHHHDFRLRVHFCNGRSASIVAGSGLRSFSREAPLEVGVLNLEGYYSGDNILKETSLTDDQREDFLKVHSPSELFEALEKIASLPFEESEAALEFPSEWQHEAPDTEEKSSKTTFTLKGIVVLSIVLLLLYAVVDFLWLGI